jgi:hypothetical protein
VGGKGGTGSSASGADCAPRALVGLDHGDPISAVRDPKREVAEQGEHVQVDPEVAVRRQLNRVEVGALVAHAERAVVHVEVDGSGLVDAVAKSCPVVASSSLYFNSKDFIEDNVWKLC